jgi:hypothetical protein
MLKERERERERDRERERERKRERERERERNVYIKHTQGTLHTFYFCHNRFNSYRFPLMEYRCDGEYGTTARGREQ